MFSQVVVLFFQMFSEFRAGLPTQTLALQRIYAMKSVQTMIKIALIFICVLIHLPLNSQITDDFSDGNLNRNLAWQGDTSHFIVNASFELQLNAPVSATSTLYLPVLIPDSAVWEILVKLDFDPSLSNRLRIYLQSDAANPSASKGYFINIGKDGNSDALEFFRQDGTSSKLLASGEIGAVAFSPKVRIRVTRALGGLWTLYADYAGGSNLRKEFSIEDKTWPGGNNQFFAFQCTYSSTRRDKFFFDDFSLKRLLPDREPPVIISAFPVSGQEVDVLFNEPLEEVSATEITNYQLSQTGTPAVALQDVSQKNLVHLVFPKSLTHLTNYTLSVSGVKDLAGNASSLQNASFQYIKVDPAAEFDILINEIMADPTPAIGLPGFEFLELFNRSNKVIDLSGYGISSGGAPQLLASYVLFPGDHLILCDKNNAEAFQKFGKVLPVSSFPSLSNDADDITLLGPGGNLIHSVSYNSSWYQDSKKAEGGWTLEMINPLNPCGGNENWAASQNLIGGTPGLANSVLRSQADQSSPELVRVSVGAGKPYEVILYFNKGLDIISAQNSSNYSISKGISIFSATLSSSDRRSIRLLLNNPLQTKVTYQVVVAKQVKDCNGNLFGSTDKLEFAIPQPIEPSDIVINEILFNPLSGGSDFLELYNKSNKVLDLGQLIIANSDSASNSSFSIGANRLFFPGDHLVITPNPNDILSKYKVQNPNLLIQNSLPSFPDDNGNVTLYVPGPTGPVIVDTFNYSSDFHHPFLRDQNGVSLERLNPENQTQNPANWHSAASSAGFATPTYKNSQFIDNLDVDDGFIEIPEKKLSPDGDGFQDFLFINFLTDKPGYQVTIRILDIEGRMVKTLAQNEIIASQGSFKWDGDTDQQTKAKVGIYLIWIQLFHTDGTVKEHRRTCIVASRF